MKQIFVLLMMVTLATGCPNADYVDLGPVLAPTPTPIPGLPQPPAGSTVVDNFDNDPQYNGSFTNDLGGYTDDDSGTTNDCMVSAGKLSISFPVASTYWYSTFQAGSPPPCYDISAFTSLQMAVKGQAGGETFRIGLSHRNSCLTWPGKTSTKVLSTAYVPSLGTVWTVYSIPMADFVGGGFIATNGLSFDLDMFVGTGIDIAYIALVP